MPEHSEDCGLRSRVEALEEDSKRNQVTHKEFFQRFEDMKERMARTDERYTQIKTDTAEIKADLRETKSAVQALNEKPARRWEGLVEKALWAVCAAVIAFALGRVGL